MIRDADGSILRIGSCGDVLPYYLAGCPFLCVGTVGERSGDGAADRNLARDIHAFDMKLADGSHRRVEFKEKFIANQRLVKLELHGMFKREFFILIRFHCSMLRKGTDDRRIFSIEEEWGIG